MPDDISENPSQSLEDIDKEPIGFKRSEFCGSLATFALWVAVTSYKFNEWELARKIKESWTGDFLKDRQNYILRSRILEETVKGLDDVIEKIGGLSKKTKIIYSKDTGFRVASDLERYQVYHYDDGVLGYSYALKRQKDSKIIKSEIRIYPGAYDVFNEDEFAVYLMKYISYVRNVIGPTIDIGDRKIPSYKIRGDDQIALWNIKADYDFIVMLLNHSHQVTPIITQTLGEFNFIERRDGGKIYSHLQRNASPAGGFLTVDEKDTFKYFIEKYSKSYPKLLNAYLKKHKLNPGMIKQPLGNNPNSPNSA